MPTLQLKLVNKQDYSIAISPEDIKNNYLFGVKLQSQNGVSFSDENISMYIDAATKEVEHFLGIKLTKQIYSETLSFSFLDFINWGFVKTSYPVNCIISMDGYLNTVKQVTYPIDWLTSKKESSGDLYHRSIYLVPVGSASGSSQNAVYSGILPQLGYHYSNTIPFYWTAKYVTGFDKIPADILNVIGKLAAINVLNIAGDIILGQAGLTNSSIGIDGLSQSLGTTASSGNTGFAGRIKSYTEEITKQLEVMKGYYRGFSWGSV